METSNDTQPQREVQTFVISGETYLVKPVGDTEWRAVNARTDEPIDIDKLREMYHASPEAKAESERGLRSTQRRLLMQSQDRSNAVSANSDIKILELEDPNLTIGLESILLRFLRVWNTLRRNQDYQKEANAIEVKIAKLEARYPQYGLQLRYALCYRIATTLRSDKWERLIKGGRPIQEDSSKYDSEYIQELRVWNEETWKMCSAYQLLEVLKKPLNDYNRFAAVYELSVPVEVVEYYNVCIAQRVQQQTGGATVPPLTTEQSSTLAADSPAKSVQAQEENAKATSSPYNLSVTFERIIKRLPTANPEGPSIDKLFEIAGLFSTKEYGVNRQWPVITNAPGKLGAIYDLLVDKHLLAKSSKREFIATANARYGLNQKLNLQRPKSEPYRLAMEAIADCVNVWEAKRAPGQDYSQITLK